MSEYSNRLLIPIRWRGIVNYLIPLAITCFVGGIVVLTKDVMTVAMQICMFAIAATAIVMFLLCVIMRCISHVFTKDCLIVRFLWIPIRKMPWSSIRSARYAKKWRDDGRPRLRWQSAVSEGHAIFVSQRGILRYNPKGDIRWLYHLQHPMKATYIILPENDAEFYLEEFRSHFPDLEEVSE